MRNRVERTVETPYGEVKAIVWKDSIVFSGKVTINRVEYNGHGQITRKDGVWGFGSYTNLSLHRTDGRCNRSHYSHSAMEKWGAELVKVAIALATPETMKEAELNVVQCGLNEVLTKQDELREEIAELEQKAKELIASKDVLIIGLQKIRRGS
jgi:hypothetical protein